MGDFEYDLIIEDENCKEVGENYVKEATKFEDILKEYIRIMEEVVESGIPSGQVHENLKVFLDEGIKKINTGSDGTGERLFLANKAKTCNDEFIEEIDEADSYLY